MSISLGRLNYVKIYLKWHNSYTIDEIKVVSIIHRLGVICWGFFTYNLKAFPFLPDCTIIFVKTFPQGVMERHQVNIWNTLQSLHVHRTKNSTQTNINVLPQK